MLDISSTTLPVEQDNHSTIGAMLLDRGKLTASDIERVLRLQENQGLQFGQAAVALGLITDRDVAEVLAQQFGYTYLTPGDGRFPDELVAAYEPFGAQCESLRGVRTQLMQRWFLQGRSALVIAGTMPGDGASLFIANLAVVFSHLGQRTLIIDANLRQPRQHSIFGLRSRQGLSDILANRAGMETFSKVEPFHLLSVLPAGTRPPNPQELISRPAFGDLNRSFSDRFDVVLIDVPSFASGADALAITRSVGGVLLLSRKDKTRLAALTAAARQISAAGAEIVGSVLTEF